MSGKGQAVTLPAIGTPGQDDGKASGRGQPKVPESPPAYAARSEVAGYIEGLVAEMRHMAHSAHLDSLAYFLEMARLEAAIQAQRLSQCGPDPRG
jgi:hypothetical protein